MNLSKPLTSIPRFLHKLVSNVKKHLPPQTSFTFGTGADIAESHIGPIYVINLDRQPERWRQLVGELTRVLDPTGATLAARAERVSACDARLLLSNDVDFATVSPLYTLRDQLFVEPQPLALPDEFDLQKPISMTQAEIAVAISHIRLWKTIAQSSASYSLILEDDVRFDCGFARALDNAWREMKEVDQGDPRFDIFYLSYSEVRYGAPKELISSNVFRPARGLWFLSGYVLSKKGAQALLKMLPCRGPIDLWINHKFGDLDVRALRRSKVNQRPDLHSTNSYSIIPSLSRIGIINNGDSSLFHQRPIQEPVFAFGVEGSGLSSLAMAISMLGYRCCSDYRDIPSDELERLRAGRTNRKFNAYVNIGSLEKEIPTLIEHYANAKYIVVGPFGERSSGATSCNLASLEHLDVLTLPNGQLAEWRDLCEHLKLAPPIEKYPTLPDIGQRTLRETPLPCVKKHALKRLSQDPSPWIVDWQDHWNGVDAVDAGVPTSARSVHTSFNDDFEQIQPERWLARNDTFPGNLGLFRPSNVAAVAGGGISLTVKEEALGVRSISAAALSSRSYFLYGRFEAQLQAVSVPGLITGFFLHRISPRQEIDIEICGKRPDQLLVNVFYNPGIEGTRYDYGYRGTPAVIELGFDASKALHKYAIEWDPHEIRWYVDECLVHRRVNWAPTPIPHLPMTLHVNAWPSRSRELAGKLSRQRLPASIYLRKVSVNGLERARASQHTSTNQVDLLDTRVNEASEVNGENEYPFR